MPSLNPQDTVREGLYSLVEDTLAPFPGDSLLSLQPLAEGIPTPYRASDHLKSFGLLLLALLVFSFLAGRGRGMTGIYLKSLLAPAGKENRSEASDARLYRFETIFFIISTLVLILFGSLMFLPQDKVPISDIRLPEVFLSVALLLSYLVWQVLVTAFFAAIFLPSGGFTVLWRNFVSSYCFVALFAFLVTLASEILHLDRVWLARALLLGWILIKPIAGLRLLPYFSSQRISLLYFFLYLCSLKMLSMGVLCKVALLFGATI